MTEPVRSSLSITLSVWRALFLREALTRISGGRAKWFWVVAEPLAHMAFMIAVLVAMRQRVVAGMDAYVWIASAMIAFFMFRRSGKQGMDAIGANRSMFAYRQVRPVDTVLVRAALEAFLMLLISIPTWLGLALLDRDIVPADPMLVIASLFGLWILGVGFGLVFSVAVELIQEAGIFINFLLMPLYMISGVIFPITIVPYPYQDWLLLNPVLHGIEGVREGFSSYYHGLPALDLAYLYVFSLCLLFFGLALQIRFSERLVAQ